MEMTIESLNQTTTLDPSAGNAPATTLLAPERVRVLAIDDNEEFCETLKQLLEPHGFDVKVVSDPVKALELYTREKDSIQLVILDYYMPNLDGGKTSLWLRKLNPKVKILVVSGAEALRLRQLRAQNLIDDYIRKPFRVEEALLAIRQVMAKPAPTK